MVRRNPKAVCSLCGVSEEGGQAGCDQAGLFHSLSAPSRSQSVRPLYVTHWAWLLILIHPGTCHSPQGELPSPSPSVYSLVSLHFLFRKMRTIIFPLGSAPLRMCSEDWKWGCREGSEHLGRKGPQSIQFSRPVGSHSLQPHGLQHTRLPCPSPIPRAYSNSCPLSQWCHPTISSSVVPFSSCLQSFPAPGSFPMSQFFASGGQSIGVQLQHHSSQWIFRTDFL